MSAQDDLQKTYAAMSDAEIMKLYESREDLTDAARDTLTAEFDARGFQAEDLEAETPHVQGATGDIHLWDFVDAIDATSTLGILQSNDIAASLRPYTPDVRRADGSEVVVMQLFVPQADSERAVKLLRKHKGLFPTAEEHNLDESYSPDESDMFVVAEFDNLTDADAACQGLAAEQVPFRRTEEQQDGKTIWVIEVPQNDIDRASEAMDRAFQSAAVDESEPS